MAQSNQDAGGAATFARVLEIFKLDPISASVADVLRVLEQKYEATYERQVLPDRRVRVSLVMANGDRIAGTGANTEAAVTHLVSRLENWPNA